MNTSCIIDLWGKKWCQFNSTWIFNLTANDLENCHSILIITAHQVGNHIDVLTGKWTAVDSGIGAGVDSYFEYLIKGSVLFQYPQLQKMFNGK